MDGRSVRSRRLPVLAAVVALGLLREPTRSTSAPRADTPGLSTAAVVRGRDALPWLRDLDVAARLVTGHGTVVTSGSWPTELEVAS